MASVSREETGRGPRYRVRWREGGRAREKWFATRRDAEAFKTQQESDALAGIVFNPRKGRQSLNSYFDDWLQTRIVKGRPLQESTKVGYRGLWRRVIRGSIGSRSLIAIGPDDVRAWYAATVTTAGRSQAAKAYRVLRAVLNTAESDDLIRQNPCRIKGAGQEHIEERPYVETALALEIIQAMPANMRALVVLAAFVGTRTGESLGLWRQDVNLLHSEITIARQSLELSGRQQFVERTKSDAGRRTLSLPKTVVDVLDFHLANFVGPEPTAPLFTGPQRKNPSLRGPLRRATLSTAWKAAKAAAGAPPNLKPHDLRHHALTLAARMPGVTTKELMARGGHSSPRAALIYQHATAERDRSIASFLDDQIAAAESARGAGAGLAELPRAKTL